MKTNGYIWWSIYVRTGCVQKLRSTHLPEIDSALGPPQFEWEVMRVEEAPGLIRLANYQNLSGECARDLIIQTLIRAYRLGGDWQISGLSNLEEKVLGHVSGGWMMRKPRPRPPAIESMMFELMPGQIGEMDCDGGWKMFD